MKRPFLLTLCSTLAAALLLAGGIVGGYALHDYLREREALRPYPAEQVVTVKAHIRLLGEMDAILANDDSEEAKCAALESLRPRMVALAPQLRAMSTYRYFELLDALGIESSSRMPTLNKMAAENTTSPSAHLATELWNYPANLSASMPPEHSVAELLSGVELLEHWRENQTKLDPLAMQELFQLWQDKLIYIHIRLGAGMPRGREHGREVERLLLATPGAADKLNAHLEAMKQLVEQHEQEDAPELSEDAEELAHAQRAWYNHLRTLLVYRLPGLTPQGRAEFARLAAFLRGVEAPTVAYLGSPMVNDEEGSYSVILHCFGTPWTDKEGAIRNRRALNIHFAGDEAAQKAAVRPLHEAGSCLLRCNPAELRWVSEQEAVLERPVSPSELFLLPGGEDMLDCLPEAALRERLQELKPNADTP